LRALALAAALAAGLAGLAPAQTAPTLSLDEALRLAKERSRHLVAQDAAAAAARAMAAAAAQRPDPTLKVGIANLPIDGPDRYSLTRDFMTMRSIGLMQELTRADKRRARAARFEREAEAAAAARDVALAALRRDTAAAWLERHFLERMRGLLQAHRDEAALQIDAAEAAYRGGRGTQADAFAARLAVAQIEDRLREMEREIVVATTRLARWVGPAAAERALAAPPSLDRSRIDEANLEAQLARHPELEWMSRQEAAAQAQAEVARSERHADWSVELMVSQRGSAYSNMVSVNLSLPLQWDRANRQDRDIAARSELAEQVRAQREEAGREQLANARIWLAQWKSDRERLAHFDASLLALAGERTRAAIAAYRGGSGTLAAVLEARRTEIEQRMERLRLEMSAAAAWARLENLVLTQAETSR
jgi:outer membrane protein TolC